MKVSDLENIDLNEKHIQNIFICNFTKDFDT